MTWDEIYEESKIVGIGEFELTRKDSARYEVIDFLAEKLGINLDEMLANNHISNIEEEISYYAQKYDISFDMFGRIQHYDLSDDVLIEENPADIQEAAEPDINKKIYHKTIRLSEKQEKFINTMDGKSFNEKLDNLISMAMEHYTEHEARKTYADVINLKAEKQELISDISKLKGLQREVTKAFHVFENMATEYGKKQISEMIKSSGFVPTTKTVSLIYALNERTEKQNTLRDIIKDHNQQTYLNSGLDKEQGIVDEVFFEFQNQEKLQNAMLPSQ